MVINKFGDHLYNGLIRVMVEHLHKAADQIEVLQGDQFLRDMKARWDHHTRSMQMIRDILMVNILILFDPTFQVVAITLT